MSRILLIGEGDSKRTAFFAKAATELSVDVQFTPYAKDFQHFDFDALSNRVVKIDPPLPHSVYIDEVEDFGREYSLFLDRANAVAGVEFLNLPREIAVTLDKVECKRILENAGICTARKVAQVESYSDLKAVMLSERINRVFIKPRFGSGAAGIIAYRRSFNREVAYTTISVVEGRLCNSKKIRCIHNALEIERLISGVLQMPALVEKWIPKVSINGRAFDIRVVWQFGKVEFAVARASKGTITNLHLGGSVLALDALNLSNQVLYEIENLCGAVMRLFPNLNSAGLDILLENNTLKPYIIEINGQGDLLYTDIENENRIYKSQIAHLANLLIL